jgi:hypothetical protein
MPARHDFVTGSAATTRMPAERPAVQPSRGAVPDRSPPVFSDAGIRMF